MEIGKCRDSKGYVKGLKNKTEVVKLDEIDDRSDERLLSCFTKCRGTLLASGCELISGAKIGNGCYAHLGDIVFGKDDEEKGYSKSFHACWVFSKCTDGEYLYASNMFLLLML